MLPADESECDIEGAFRRPGGELLSGCPERSQRGTRGKRNRQARLRRPCLHDAYPWTPFYEDRQLGCLGSQRKGAGGQGIGFRSITAAAGRPVNFGCFFYRWRARLLGGWGSSLAQGISGRVRTPAPTRIQGRFHFSRRGRSMTGPRAHTVRPYGEKRTGSVGSETAGAEAKPHQSQFSSRSGPQWGRTEWHPSTPGIARRKGRTTSKG